jgi:hypothetical protein
MRALLRHRASLVRLATPLKNRVHAVLADRGISERSACGRRPDGPGWPVLTPPPTTVARW